MRLWDARTGEFLRALPGKVGRVIDVAFAADGKVLATAGLDAAGNPALRFWDPKTGAERAALKGHPGAVVRVTEES